MPKTKVMPSTILRTMLGDLLYLQEDADASKDYVLLACPGLVDDDNFKFARATSMPEMSCTGHATY